MADTDGDDLMRMLDEMHAGATQHQRPDEEFVPLSSDELNDLLLVPACQDPTA